MEAVSANLFETRVPCAARLGAGICQTLKHLTLDELGIPIVLHGDEIPITGKGKIWSSSAVVFSWSSMLNSLYGPGTMAWSRLGIVFGLWTTRFLSSTLLPFLV